MGSSALLATLLVASSCFAQSARDYYNELYAAGGLDRLADRYVCFFEDPQLKTFFLFAESKELRDYMTANGTFAKLPKEHQTELKKDFLLVRGYNKGVAFASQDFYRPDNNAWISDTFPVGKKTARLRFTIVWETLRFSRSVEILNAKGTVQTEAPAFGKCEFVAPGVRQDGK